MSTQEIIKQFEPQQHNLLQILHAIQDADPANYLTEEALEETARHLGITKSAVYGVARYYTMFSLKPRGKFIIRVCASAARVQRTRVSGAGGAVGEPLRCGD